MKILRGHEADARSERRGPTFTGPVWADSVLASTDGVMINHVFFEPRSRTHWHRHEAGQILIVLSGAGRVYSRDGSGSGIGIGDCVWIPPAEEHWHGADDASFMLHLAVSLGETEWLDAVTDEEYDR
jgi:quercetin dioxygenase-like cupin family protein